MNWSQTKDGVLSGKIKKRGAKEKKLHDATLVAFSYVNPSK